MKKEIKEKINELFNEMLKDIKVKWIQKEYSHKNIKRNKDIYISKTIGEYRLKAINISKENIYNWEAQDRNDFCQWFWKKTTPYFFLKKDINELIK